MTILFLMQVIFSFRFPDFRNASEVKTKLAFTVITHDQLGRFEILLNMIFRPYNAYCIYVGSNTNKIYKQRVEKLVNCYKNQYPESAIFMASNVHDVTWGEWSVIEADLICMKQLLALNSQ